MAAVDAEYCEKLALPAALLFAGNVDICDHGPGVVDCGCECGAEPDMSFAPPVAFGGPLSAPCCSIGKSEGFMLFVKSPRPGQSP